MLSSTLISLTPIDPILSMLLTHTTSALPVVNPFASKILPKIVFSL